MYGSAFLFPSSLSLLLVLFASSGQTQEVTVQNDSLTDFDDAVIQAGFVANERAAAWMTSPCDGDIRAVQVLWRSLTGGAPISIEDSVTIHDSGTFPTPGTTLETIVAPVMTDGVINEFRFLDDMMAVPLIVPVTQDQEFVVSFRFAQTPPATGPSVVTDIDGCQEGSNGIFAIPPNLWFSSCLLGVTGDFVIRAVVDCDTLPQMGDLSIVKIAGAPTYTPGGPLDYTIVATNPGPGSATSVTVLDFFDSQLTNLSWLCQGSNGASCAASGNGNIAQPVNLPANSDVTFMVTTTVDAGASGVIENEAQIVVPVDFDDPNSANNMDSVSTLEAEMEIIFADSLEALVRDAYRH